MNVINPDNVPISVDPTWRVAALYRCSESQALLLDDLLCREEMTGKELFGGGYESLRTLSRWAAHWGIERLEEIGVQRCVAEADRATEEQQEVALKAWIANYYRAKAGRSG